MGFTLVNPKEYKKLAVLVLLLCSLAQSRKREVQKRWLREDQRPGFLDHPVVTYLVENAATFGVAYAMLRWLPKPIKGRPFYTFFWGVVSVIVTVDPLLLFEKFAAEYLYPHVPYFSTRTVSHDAWTMIKDYFSCNFLSNLTANVIATGLVEMMTEQEYMDNIVNAKPLEIVPFLGKYVFCRFTIDVLFGILHRAMHEYPIIYNNLHKRHHEHQAPQTPTNFHFHFLDIFLEAMFPLQASIVTMALLGFPANHNEQTCLAVILVYFESASHTGKEIPIVTWFPPLSPLLDYFTGCDQRLIEYHTRHHQLYRCNYSISPWVDKLMGTYRIDLPEHYNSAEAEQVQKE